MASASECDVHTVVFSVVRTLPVAAATFALRGQLLGVISVLVLLLACLHFLYFVIILCLM